MAGYAPRRKLPPAAAAERADVLGRSLIVAAGRALTENVRVPFSGLPATQEHNKRGVLSRTMDH